MVPHLRAAVFHGPHRMAVRRHSAGGVRRRPPRRGIGRAVRRAARYARADPVGDLDRSADGDLGDGLRRRRSRAGARCHVRGGDDRAQRRGRNIAAVRCRPPQGAGVQPSGCQRLPRGHHLARRALSHTAELHGLGTRTDGVSHSGGVPRRRHARPVRGLPRGPDSRAPFCTSPPASLPGAPDIGARHQPSTPSC